MHQPPLENCWNMVPNCDCLSVCHHICPCSRSLHLRRHSTRSAPSSDAQNENRNESGWGRACNVRLLPLKLKRSTSHVLPRPRAAAHPPTSAASLVRAAPVPCINPSTVADCACSLTASDLRGDHEYRPMRPRSLRFSRKVGSNRNCL